MTTRDRGFTLIETVISIVLIGVVGAVLAAVFTVIIRTTPTSADRVDDSRTLLGLTNWLPQDVRSADVTGFVKGSHATSCATPSVPASQGLLELRSTGGGATIIADYRFVDEGPGLGSIFRYTCRAGQDASSLRLTPPLRTVTGGTTEAPAPVDVTLFDPSMPDVDGYGVEFGVVVVDDDGSPRDALSLEAFTDNVVTTLPPLVPVPTTSSPTTTTTTTAPNQPPHAADLWVSLPLDAILDVILPATDPDGDPLTATIVLSPAEVAVVSTGNPLQPLEYSIQAQSGASPGATIGPEYVATYTVSDGALTSNQATIRITATGGPPPPSSTSTTTTMPATTTTTTTTTVPCVASIASVSPGSVARTPAGHLANDLTVSINRNGWCHDLVATFDTGAGGPTRQIEFGGANVAVVRAKDHLWTTGSHTFRLRQGSNGGEISSASVSVS